MRGHGNDKLRTIPTVRMLPPRWIVRLPIQAHLVSVVHYQPELEVYIMKEAIPKVFETT